MLVNASFSTKRIAAGGGEQKGERRAHGGGSFESERAEGLAAAPLHAAAPGVYHDEQHTIPLPQCQQLVKLPRCRSPWKKLDLPEPLAPTMQLILGENGSVMVWSL
jgi:hypothetical protein